MPCLLALSGLPLMTNTDLLQVSSYCTAATEATLLATSS